MNFEEIYAQIENYELLYLIETQELSGIKSFLIEKKVDPPMGRRILDVAGAILEIMREYGIPEKSDAIKCYDLHTGYGIYSQIVFEQHNCNKIANIIQEIEIKLLHYERIQMLYNKILFSGVGTILGESVYLSVAVLDLFWKSKKQAYFKITNQSKFSTIEFITLLYPKNSQIF